MNKWTPDRTAEAAQVIAEQAADIIMQSPLEHSCTMRAALEAYYQLWPKRAIAVLKEAQG